MVAGNFNFSSFWQFNYVVRNFDSENWTVKIGPGPGPGPKSGPGPGPGPLRRSTKNGTFLEYVLVFHVFFQIAQGHLTIFSSCESVDEYLFSLRIYIPFLATDCNLFFHRIYSFYIRQ